MCVLLEMGLPPWEYVAGIITAVGGVVGILGKIWAEMKRGRQDVQDVAKQVGSNHGSTLHGNLADIKTELADLKKDVTHTTTLIEGQGDDIRLLHHDVQQVSTRLEGERRAREKLSSRVEAQFSKLQKQTEK